MEFYDNVIKKEIERIGIVIQYSETIWLVRKLLVNGVINNGGQIVCKINVMDGVCDLYWTWTPTYIWHF